MSNFVPDTIGGDWSVWPNNRLYSVHCVPQLTTKVATGFSGSGTFASGTGGSTTNADTATRSYVSLSGGTTSGGVGSWVDTAAELRLDHLIGRSVTFIVKTDPALTTTRLWVALYATTTPSGTDSPTTNIIGVRYSTGASDTGWVAYTGNGVSGQASGLIAAIAAATEYIWQFRVTSATTVDFYCNGVFVYSASATLPGATMPASSTYFHVGVFCTVLASSAARTISFSKVSALVA